MARRSELDLEGFSVAVHMDRCPDVALSATLAQLVDENSSGACKNDTLQSTAVAYWRAGASGSCCQNSVRAGELVARQANESSCFRRSYLGSATAFRDARVVERPAGR